jgi:hypothetical protein
MRLTSILLAGNVILSPAVSHGADLPKEGTDSWTQRLGPYVPQRNEGRGPFTE